MQWQSLRILAMAKSKSKRKNTGAYMAQGGRHSGIPDYLAFLRLCPNAPGFLNLRTWYLNQCSTAPAQVVYQQIRRKSKSLSSVRVSKLQN
jgi:hypothetical protein